jgi:hypothetical protein
MRMNSPKISIQPPVRRPDTPRPEPAQENNETKTRAAASGRTINAIIIWCLISGVIVWPDHKPATPSDWAVLLIEWAFLAFWGWALWRLFARSWLMRAIKALPADTVSIINPLRWRHEHQLAWIVACALGAAIGLLYGFSRVPFGSYTMHSAYFLLWLQNPEWYWHWAVMGAAVAGLAFYLMRLLKNGDVRPR